MLVSLTEFRDRKLRNLHARRLESLCANYVNAIGVVPGKGEILEENSSYQNGLSENVLGGAFSSKEILTFIILGCILILFPILFKFKLAALSLVPYVLMINYLKNSRLKAREKVFIDEYPAVLLATASNLKAGLSVYSALERAIQLLDDTSVIKIELKLLLDKVSRGVPKEDAVRDFARDIRLPELRLFKRAFLLVLIHGGKFSRTLERLAEVSRDRDALIKSANVSTASMRMTANVLLCMAPLLLFMLSFRTKNFWNTMFENSTAFGLACTGVSIVFLSFYFLRKLSDFKP